MDKQPIVINNWIKLYLIGAMSNTQANDEGKGWRELITVELDKLVDNNNNPLYVFNPCNEEQSKTGLGPKAFHAQIKKWIKEGNTKAVADGSKLIWAGKTYIEANKKGIFQLKSIPGDFQYVENSDFLICKIDPQDKPAGTYFEAGYAMKLGIPIYVLQTQEIDNYSESFTGWVYASGGDFFKTIEELINYIKEKYNLKRKQ
jgi:hypothetical protein